MNINSQGGLLMERRTQDLLLSKICFVKIWDLFLSFYSVLNLKCLDHVNTFRNNVFILFINETKDWLLFDIEH